MHKYLIFVFTLVLTSLVVLADDFKFMNALKNCSSYSESGTVNTEGMNVTSYKKILGWENDRCVYQETLQFAGMNSCITCKFSKNHINELVSVMQAYSVVQKYTNEKVDTSNISSVQNNPVVKVWNKYLQESSICVMNRQ